MYVAKLEHIGEGRFVAIGRIFSGTITSGADIRIMGIQYQFGKKYDHYIKKAQSVFVLRQNHLEEVESVSAGNLCAVKGIDMYILKTATIANDESTYPLCHLKHSTSPSFHVAVEPKNPADLPKMLEALKRLSKSDLLSSIYIEENGQHVVAGTCEFHVDNLLKNLEIFIGVELFTMQPFVSLCETVVDKSPVCMSKSPNRHSRMWCTCSPLDDVFVNAMPEISMEKDIKLRAGVLSQTYGWQLEEAKRIWTFGPEDNPSNVLVDVTKGVQYLNEIKDSTNAAFAWATKEGVLAAENMRGIRFNIVDVSMMTDAIHRGGGQTIPMAKRVFYACQLSAQPRIMEPIYTVDIACPSSTIANVYSVINSRGGQIITEHTRKGSTNATVRCYLPALHSIGLTSELSSSTGGYAFAQYTLDYWKVIPDNPLENGTRSSELIAATRKRKELSLEIPALDRFLDKL